MRAVLITSILALVVAGSPTGVAPCAGAHPDIVLDPDVGLGTIPRGDIDEWEVDPDPRVSAEPNAYAGPC